MSYFKNNTTFGNAIADNVQDMMSDLGTAIMEGTCRIRAKYPRTFRRGGILTPILDKLCSDNNFPVGEIPPPPPFSGGQCCDKTYIVKYTYKLASCDSNRNVLSISEAETEVTGRILGTDISPKGGGQSSTNVEILYDKCDGLQRVHVVASTGAPAVESCEGIDPSDRAYKSTVLLPNSSVNILNIRTKDGSPDNCGNIDGSDDNDPPFDPDDFNRNFRLCATPENSDNQRCVDISIDFSDSLDDDGNYPYKVDGQDYKFTPDGVEPGGESQEDGGDENPEPDGLDQDIEEEVETKEESDPSVRYVTTELTQEPYKGKTILHLDPLDNDYFAGYFSWIIVANDKQYRTPQIPIRKSQQVFVNNVNATGYRIYTINGAKLKVTVFKDKGDE